MQLSFTLEGEQMLSRRLRIVEDRIKDWSPAFQDTAILLKQVASEDVFNTQGGAVGEHWSPLSRAYSDRKAQKFPGKGILEATGAMRKSFQTLWKADMAQIWNTADYFKFHQSNKPRGHLPRRVMLKLAEKQKQAIVKIFHTYFRKAIEQTV